MVFRRLAMNARLSWTMCLWSKEKVISMRAMSRAITETRSARCSRRHRLAADVAAMWGEVMRNSISHRTTPGLAEMKSRDPVPRFASYIWPRTVRDLKLPPANASHSTTGDSCSLDGAFGAGVRAAIDFSQLSVDFTFLPLSNCP